MKLAEKIARIQAATPKVSAHGQLYARKPETQQAYSRVNLYTLFVSDENTHLLRNHVFSKSREMTPAEWAQWFSDNLHDIHANAVLPGIEVRTNKQWAVERILGWVGDAEHKTDTSRVGRKRHKAKQKGRKNGQVHIRGRHRNRKR